MATEEKKMTGIDETEAGYVQEPELSPVEQLDVDSFIVSEKEIEEDMKAAGMNPVHTAGNTETPVAETAIGLEEDAFTAEPELSPIEQLEADEYVVSPAEIAKDRKKAGIE